ncbi:hypothetical protein ACROYT_G023728 [Oculina patagonica]
MNLQPENTGEAKKAAKKWGRGSNNPGRENKDSEAEAKGKTTTAQTRDRGDKSGEEQHTHTKADEEAEKPEAIIQAKKIGKNKAIATIQVVRMKKGHSFELISGGRRGKTTAPNRSTTIRTRLSAETTEDKYCKGLTTLHKAWPFKNQELTFSSVIIKVGNTKIGYSRSDMAMFTMK